MAITTPEGTEGDIRNDIETVLDQERELAEIEQQLMQNEQLRTFLQRQRELQARIGAFWKEVEQRMIAADIKSLKGDWGTLTIAERLDWTHGPELAPKWYKKVVDTKKLSDFFRLTGKAPKGAEPSYTKYLTKRLKGAGE